jgi:hypothetical protein
MSRNCLRTVAALPVLVLLAGVAGCQSDPSVHLARVNASILTWVACNGVPRGETGTPGGDACAAAHAAEASMEPLHEFGEVRVFIMKNPGPLFAPPTQAPGDVTIGPYNDDATCETVRGLVDRLGLSTTPCESRFAAGKLLFD